jgi:PAS domain S-box-containing protein
MWKRSLALKERYNNAKKWFERYIIAVFILAFMAVVVQQFFHTLHVKRLGGECSLVDALWSKDIFFSLIFLGLIAAGGWLLWRKFSALFAQSHSDIDELSRAIGVIENSQTILMVWKNSPGWPLEFASSNISLFGYTSQEVMAPDWNYESIIHPHDKEATTKEVQNYMAKGQNEYQQVYRIRHKNGKYHWVQDHTKIIRDKNGDITSIEGLITDITKLHTLQGALHEKEELLLAQSRHAAMGEMISMIAHQWRQPLATMSMNANNILLDIEFGDLDADMVQQHLKEILNQTQYLSHTIDDFRDFFKPNKEPIQTTAQKIFTDAMGVMGPALKNHNIEVIYQLNAPTPFETFDKELMQVCINLIKNSKEALANRKNPTLWLKAYEEDNIIFLRVCDNGSGIPEEIRNQIFDPYFTTKEEKDGTGLGLYMSKSIVEKHLKGTLTYSQEETNTCFEISLPKT